MSRKMRRTIGKWLNWKTGTAVLAVLLIAVLVVQFTVGWGNIWGSLFGTAGPEGGQTCIPSCSETDGKFLSVAGQRMDSFAQSRIVLWVSVPADWPSFELGFFDGDSGKDNNGNVGGMWVGNWDETTDEIVYRLYADPVKNGSGTQPIQEWRGNRDMPNNAWFNATLNNDPRALGPNQKWYYYRLECTRQGNSWGISAFKVRSTAWLTTGKADLVDASLSIVGMVGNENDLRVMYPNFQSYTNLGPSNYTGDWQLYFYVPTETVYLEMWDGDFDRGSWNNTALDNDDPNTEGVPPWAGSDAKPEGIGGWLGKGSPADNYSWNVWRVGEPVWYQIVDPAGVPIHINGEPGNPMCPSGTEEWERFSITSDPGRYPVPNVADKFADRIQPGMYRWDIHGLDLHNTVWVRVNYEICSPEGCPPPPWCDTECSCPRTIGYWKNNVNKVLNNKKGTQETRESLEFALRNIALVSPLYRSGIDLCNPAPIGGTTPLTLEEANRILQRKANDYPGCDVNSMLARALQQNLATWLNLGSSKIGYNVTTTLNGIAGGYYEGSMWEALNYAQNIILYQRGDAGLLERAKDIADMINNGELNVDPEDRACDQYTNVIPPAKQPPRHNDMPKQPKHPEPPAPIVGCDVPRTNQYNVENPTNNPFYGIKFEYQSGTEIRDGGFDQFRFTLPADVVNGMTSIQLEAKAADIVGMATLDGCQFNGFTPCERAVESNGFIFTFQGAVDNGDGTLTLVFHVQNMNGFGLSHATFGLPDGVVPASPSGNYQSAVCP